MLVGRRGEGGGRNKHLREVQRRQNAQFEQDTHALSCRLGRKVFFFKPAVDTHGVAIPTHSPEPQK